MGSQQVRGHTDDEHRQLIDFVSVLEADLGLSVNIGEHIEGWKIQSRYFFLEVFDFFFVLTVFL